MKILVLIGALALSGCDTLPTGAFHNRVSCTLGGGTALYTSMYGQIGVSSKIDDVDADVMCKTGP